MVLKGKDYEITVDNLIKLINNENAEEDKYIAKEDELEKEHRDNTALYAQIENKRNSIVMNSKSSGMIDDLFHKVSKSKKSKLEDLSDDANGYSKNIKKDFKLVNKLLPNCVRVESATLDEAPHSIIHSHSSDILNFLNLLTGDITDSNTMMML